MGRFRDRSEQSTVELAVEFTGIESELAYQVIDGDGKKKWIPFSVTEERHGQLKGGAGTITVHEWFAEKEGMI